MKISIITSFPFPNGKATANRVMVFAEELIKIEQIKNIQIVSSSSDKNNSTEFRPFINITNIQSLPFNKNNLIFRFYRELLISIRLWITAKQCNANIIIITIPSALLLVPIIIFKKPKVLILDLRDAVWTYLPKGYINNIISFFLKALFKIASKKADLIVVTNKNEASLVKAISGESPIIVANGISSKKLTTYLKIPVKPISKQVNLSYIGNVGIAQELEVLISLAERYRVSLNINIIGDGAKLKFLKQEYERSKLNNISFHGSIPPELVEIHMNKADILFAQIGNNFSSAIPTKVFEYIASGRRVLLGLPNGPAKDIFSNFHGVKIFEVGDVSGLIRSYNEILEICFDEHSRQKNIDYLANDFIREKTILNLTNKLKEII